MRIDDVSESKRNAPRSLDRAERIVRFAIGFSSRNTVRPKISSISLKDDEHTAIEPKYKLFEGFGGLEFHDAGTS